jgi:hypothetical protein
MPFSTLANNYLMQGLLDYIQTGGGTAELRIVDFTASPDVTVVSFPLSNPEYTISNGRMYTSHPLVGTAVASAAVRNCTIRLYNRAGNQVGRSNLDFDFANQTLDYFTVFGIAEFVSGYKYEMTDHVIGY